MKKPKRRVPDTANPAWTKEMFARARPAHDAEPDLVADPPRIGRPPLAKPKQQISLRLDPDVITAYRNTGAGWQKLMQRALAKAAPKRRKSKAA